MRLNKICTCCKKDLTSKDVLKITRTDSKSIGGEALWVNCKACKSTLILPKRKKV